METNSTFSLCHGVILYGPSANARIKIVWTPGLEDPYILCKTPVSACVEYLHGLNWVWHARILEHDYSHLCPVCVSRLMLVYLRIRGCPQCSHVHAVEDAEVLQRQRAENYKPPDE